MRSKRPKTPESFPESIPEEADILDRMFGELANALETRDPKTYLSLQINLVRSMPSLIKNHQIDVAGVPKLLLDLEKLKMQDTGSGQGDIIRRAVLNNTAN